MVDQGYGGMTSPTYRRYPKKRRVFPDIKKLVYINIDIPCNIMTIDNIVHEMQHAVDFCSLNPKAYNGNGYVESTLYKEVRAYSKAQVKFTDEEIRSIQNAENTGKLKEIDKLHILYNRVLPSYSYSMRIYSQDNIEKNDLKNHFFELLQKGEIMVLPYAL